METGRNEMTQNGWFTATKIIVTKGDAGDASDLDRNDSSFSYST